MGNRIAPDGGKRISFVLLALALVASLVQVVAVAPPAQAVAGENGPAPIPGASTAGLSGGQWETKNQHRIWYNETQGRWDAILPTASGWQIARGAIPETFGGSPLYGPTIGLNDNDERPDVYWDENTDQLYVLMSGGIETELYRLQYAADTYTIEAGPIVVPDMGSGEARAAILRDSTNGDLWASVMVEEGLLVSRSTDDGASWAPTPINLYIPSDEGQTQLTAFSDGASYVGVAAAEDGDGGLESGRYSQYVFYKLDLANAANWTSVTRATATMTVTVNPVAGETFTIGGRTYLFQTPPIADVAGNIAIGATIDGTRANIVNAINGTGTPGTGTYAPATFPHNQVRISGFSGTPNAVITALESGPAGNSIVLAETMSGTGNEFAGAAVALSGGSSSWSREAVNIQSGNTGAVVHADDELSLVTHNNIVYMVSETQRSGEQIGVEDDPQVVLFRRTAGGTWQQSTVKLDQQTAELDRKRPVVAVHNDNLYIMAINGLRTNSYFWARPISGIPWGTLTPWAAPQPLFNTQFEAHRNNIVPREPTNTATGLPVLIDWAWDIAGDDRTVWQTLLPNSGNQAPGVNAGPNTTVAASPATALNFATVTNDTLGGPVNWAWTVVSGPAGPGAGVSFTTPSGVCSGLSCNPLGTTAAFSGGLGTYVLRLTATESGTNPLTNFDDVTITVNTARNTPPALTVSNPKNGDQYQAGAAVRFEASATDTQSGNISSAIVWTSSRDGIIGFGGLFVKSNLSVGTHTIKASVTDGQNSVSSPNITVTIGSGGGGGGGGGGANQFIDDNGHIFENAITWLAAKGITTGCNPPTNNRFCPDDPVTRGQMAVFLVRAFDYADNGGGDLFVDDDGLFYENSADRLFTAGVTLGCNPPTNNRYCGERNVTRGQMAAFLSRAFNLPAYTGPDRFVDDNGDIFEGAIERLAQAGITLGCNPPTNNRYCPDDPVTRGQMAAFLKRAFGE